MALPSCDECQAIYRELSELIELSRRHAPGPGATLQQLVAWFEQRNLDEEYTTRIRPALANVRRRMVEHQESTGHHIPSPAPAGGPTSWN